MTTNQAEPSDAEQPPSAGSKRWQLRLIISIPALLVLFTLGGGLVSYELFSSRWYELDQLGAGEIARELLRGHLYAMIVLSITAVAMGLALAATILRPIRAINTVARLIVQGDFNRRAPTVNSTNELGDLTRSFNSMIDFVNQSIEKRNRYLAEGVMTGVVVVDGEGSLSGLNPAGEQMLGVGASRMAGRSLEALARAADPAIRPFWARISELWRASESSQAEELALGSCEEARTLLLATSFVGDGSADRSGGMIVNFRDSAHIRNLNAQLSKTDQLAALGTFTMGLAHELRNPLGSIKGMVQLLQLNEGSSEKTAEIVGRVVSEVDRLDGFIRELLDFANQSPAPARPIDLDETLEQAENLARREARAGSDGVLEIVHEAPASAVWIRADGERLSQAFANIIRNAIEATPAGHRVALSVSHIAGQRGDIAEVRIHNTGSTIAPADRSNIFDPFFSTKDKGSGLGLAVAYQIVSQDGGTLEVEAEPDAVTFVARFAALDHAAFSATIVSPDDSPLEAQCA